MKQLKMTFASWPYDRTEALKDGVVKPRGIDLKFLASHPGDTFLRMLEHQEFESSEMSMSSLLMEKERQNRFVAIPVFTSRTFRHNGLFVRTDSEIREPQDLIGKKVGLPEYTITSTLWIRGILEHEYGVHPSTVEWYVERWGRGRSHAAALDFQIDVFDLLAVGEVNRLAAHAENGIFVRRYISRRDREGRISSGGKAGELEPPALIGPGARRVGRVLILSLQNNHHAARRFAFQCDAAGDGGRPGFRLGSLSLNRMISARQNKNAERKTELLHRTSLFRRLRLRFRLK